MMSRLYLGAANLPCRRVVAPNPGPTMRIPIISAGAGPTNGCCWRLLPSNTKADTRHGGTRFVPPGAVPHMAPSMTCSAAAERLERHAALLPVSPYAQQPFPLLIQVTAQDC